MAATPFLLQLPDPDTAPARFSPDGGADTYVVMAESSADAKAFVQNYSPAKVWANVTPVQGAEATDMTDWKLRTLVYNVDGSIKVDLTVQNTGVAQRAVLASGVLTSSVNYADTDTVTVGGRVYTFQTVLTAVDGHVLIGANEAASILNLVHAINNSGGVNGTDYRVTAADPNVTAVAGAHTATVTAKPSLTAAQANAIATLSTMHSPGDGTWGAATLTGGVDTTNKMSSLAIAMASALNASASGIAGASWNNGTHTLTVAAASDNLGDHLFRVFVTPPDTDYREPNGVGVSNGTTVPGFVGVITDGGAAGAALTVAFAADTYGIPSLVAKGRTQQ